MLLPIFLKGAASPSVPRPAVPSKPGPRGPWLFALVRARLVSPFWSTSFPTHRRTSPLLSALSSTCLRLIRIRLHTPPSPFKSQRQLPRAILERELAWWQPALKVGWPRRPPSPSSLIPLSPLPPNQVGPSETIRPEPGARIPPSDHPPRRPSPRHPPLMVAPSSRARATAHSPPRRSFDVEVPSAHPPAQGAPCDPSRSRPPVVRGTAPFAAEIALSLTC